MKRPQGKTIAILALGILAAAGPALAQHDHIGGGAADVGNQRILRSREEGAAQHNSQHDANRR